MKRILPVAAATITICLMATAAFSQSSNLRLRFHVPFSFSTKNGTFPAGEYEVTQPAHFFLRVHNLVGNQTSAFEPVVPAQSRKEGDGRVRLVFHRYDNQYFLAFVSDGSWNSTYDFQISKEETLANASPRKRITIVSVNENGTTEVASDLTGRVR